MPAALVSSKGVLPLHLQFQALEGGVDPFLEFRGVQPADGVLHHDQMRLEFPRLGLRQHQRPERLGGDYHPGQAALP